MPITINGSGTITGLAVGGLPDGTVDGDTLASGVGGKILQVVSANSATNTQFTNQTSCADHTNHTISITPTEAGSKIVLLAQFRFTVIKSHIETNSKWR